MAPAPAPGARPLSDLRWFSLPGACQVQVLYAMFRSFIITAQGAGNGW